MKALKIYASERDDGLEDKILAPGANAFVAEFCATPFVRDDANPVHAVLASRIQEAQSALGFAKDDDLYPILSILVSVGWNLNGDIFDRQEVWAARHSPVNKPFNLNHIPSQIIGHITGSVGVTSVSSDMQVISDDTSVEQLPDKYHILTSAVIYRHVSAALRDPELKGQAERIIQELATGKWFVSMEALFSNFDYGLIHENGTHQVVARQASTAFLTKHLKAYGGTGEYRGSRIGRILREITFAGKALTDHPANPESVIFEPDMFRGVMATESEVRQLVSAHKKHNNGDSRKMDETIKQLEAQLAEANRKLEEAGQQATQAKLDAKDAEIAAANERIKVLEAELTEAKASLKGTEESRDKAVAEKIQTEQKLAVAEKTLADQAEAAKRASRIAALTDKGIETSRAEELVATFADLDDTRFGKLVEMQAKPAAAKCDEPEDEEEEAKAEAAAEEVLDSAATVEDVALASTVDNGQDQEIHTALATYLSERWLGRKTTKSEVN